MRPAKKVFPAIPSWLGDFGNENHDQQYLSNIELPRAFQEPSARDNRPAFPRHRAVDESG
jgi:hypothetical protein